MTDNPQADRFTAPQEHPAAGAGPAAALRALTAQVMAIQDMTLGDGTHPLRFRGQLIAPADEAFQTLRPPFEELGFTPRLRHENGLDAIYAMPGVFGTRPRRMPWINIVLLVATILSVFFVGLQQELHIGLFQAIRALATNSVPPGVDARLIPTAAEFRHALLVGGLYTLSLLGILGAHEMGHYIMARRHHVDVTPPFFIPLPFNILGTLGAVIAMREPAPNRRIQFDIGIAGPLAGLVVAVPVMIIGLMLSQVGTTESFIQQLPEPIRDQSIFFQEGQSLAYLGLKYLVFGQVLPRDGLDVWVHPVAFAAWAGFLVTALNLLPIGQLDGGHVLYGLFGERARVVRLPIIGALIIMALAGSLNDAGLINVPFGWSGWWIWVLMLIFLVRGHAPVLDEITELDPARKALGVLMLIIFVLIFTPRPIAISAGPLSALMGAFM